MREAWKSLKLFDLSWPDMAGFCSPDGRWFYGKRHMNWYEEMKESWGSDDD